MRLIRLVAASAIGVGLLSVVVSPPIRGAVEPTAEIRVTFSHDCAGRGHWWVWDAVADPDPTDAPGYTDSAEFEIEWGTGTPIQITTIVGSSLEPNRVAFRMTDAAGTEVFRTLLAVSADRLVLDVTLDCSTIPYSIVSLGDTAMESPTPPVGPPMATVAGIGCLIGTVVVTLWQRSPRAR